MAAINRVLSAAVGAAVWLTMTVAAIHVLGEVARFLLDR